MSTAKKTKTLRQCISESKDAENDALGNAPNTQVGVRFEGCATSVKDFPCAVYSAFFGKTGPMVFVSKEWMEWTGYSSEELHQDPEAWPRCIHPDDRARAVSVRTVACRDEVPYSLEYRVVHRDTGRVRYVRDQGLLSEDKETAIVRVDGIVTDISELKKLENELQEYRDRLEEMVDERTAELSRANEVLRIEDTERRRGLEALGKSEDKFKTIFENVTDVICYTDNRGRILEVNRRIEDVFGYKPEEVTGKDFAAIGLLRAGDLPRLAKLFKDTVLKGEPVSPVELEFKHKNGATVFVEVGSRFIEGSGAVAGIVTIIKDVTDRRGAEQSLKSLNEELSTAIQELTAANRELVDFARVAAHDLKAPLRAIGSLAGIVSAEYGDKVDEQGRDMLETLVGRASRMYTHIDSVLEYSQIGRVAEEKQKVNLNKLLEEVIVSIAPPENIAISVGNRLPTMVCDRTRMMQVFRNLVGNAVKYMDKPRGRVKVDCVEEGGFWKFSVADNGRGIREKYFEKIFQMFQTLVSRDEIEGTGIGLAVVKKLVEMSGGSIWVESQAGEGTTFFFTLPRQVRRPSSLGHKCQSIS